MSRAKDHDAAEFTGWERSAPYLSNRERPAVFQVMGWLGASSFLALIIFATGWMWTIVGVFLLIAGVEQLWQWRVNRTLLRQIGDRFAEHCPGCLYDMGGLSGRQPCPECGAVSERLDRYRVWQASFPERNLIYSDPGEDRDAEGRFAGAVLVPTVKPPFTRAGRWMATPVVLFIVGLLALLGVAIYTGLQLGYRPLIVLGVFVGAPALLIAFWSAFRHSRMQKRITRRAARVCPGCLAELDEMEPAPCASCGLTSNGDDRFDCWRGAFPKLDLGAPPRNELRRDDR